VRESRWQQFDPILIMATVGILLIGVSMIHSATCGSPCAGPFPPSEWAVRQGTMALVGLGLLALVALLDYSFYRAYAYHLYVVGLILLVAVLIIGRGGADDDYGAKRWIYFGFFDLQPSEVGKLSMLVALARVFGDKGDGPLSNRRLLASIVLMLVPTGLVFLQPDLGTSLSFVFIWIVMVLIAGMKGRQVAALVGTTLASIPLMWFALREYQRDRIATFIGTLVDLEHAAFDEGYNVLQARISIGSGGLFGRGWLEGTQTQLDYLRVKHSDFIFSAFAEELGFIGALVLFGLFILLLFRITRAGDLSWDEFGRFLSYGVAAMFLFQAAANLGANLTLLPVTGIPLPFVSYGRTALLTNLIALGMVESVLLYRLKYRY
jgi:rod shape determining protein RodA